MKTKKGSDDADLFFYVIISMVLLVFMVFIYGYILDSFKLNIIYHPDDMEEKLLITRLLYSPNCFAYYDIHTLRVHPLVIDINKFNNDQLNNCISSDNLLKLRLIDSSNKINELNTGLVKDESYTISKQVLVYNNNIKKMNLEMVFSE